MNFNINFLRSAFRILAKYILFAVPFSVLFVFAPLPFSYISSKAFVFRILVELGAVCAVFDWAFTRERNSIRREAAPAARASFSHPIIIALFAFLLSAVFSTFFAVDSWHAFFGNMERSEGVFMLIHYAVFVFLAVYIFSEKDWVRFFKMFIIAAFLMVFYAYLQYFGVESFPFALPPSGRPGSFLANPAFLSSYILLALGAAGIIYVSSLKGSLWRYFSAITALLSVPVLFFAAVRASIGGLIAAAFIFFFLSALRSKDGDGNDLENRIISIRTARIAFGMLAIITLFFLLTRSLELWKSVPGIARFAAFSLEDASLRTRLIALGSSAAAFLERPFFGWGPENFLIAYNQHYNPSYALYEEAWFDRPHNKFIEIAVTQGAVGFLAYLGLIGAFIASLLRLSRSASLRHILFSVLAAYLAQNFFLFDTPASSLGFFALLGFAASHSRFDRKFSSKLPRIFVSAGSGAARWLRQTVSVAAPFVTAGVTAFVAFSLYTYHYIPYSQASLFVSVAKSQVGEKVLRSSDRFLLPYNFIQPELRQQFLDLLDRSGLIVNPAFAPLVSRATNAMEEVISREPNYDPRHRIRLAEIYTDLGKDNPVYFKVAEEHARKALTLAPKRQDIYYVLAFSLAGQGRFDEAIATMREAVSLEPKVAKARYHLGLELALGGKTHWDEAVYEFEKANDIGFVKLLPSDVANIVRIYKEMLYAYIGDRDKERVVMVASAFKRTPDAPVEDLDRIISLAEMGEWEILSRAVRGQ